MSRARLHHEPLLLPFAGLLVVLALGATQYANNLGFFFTFWLATIAAGGLIGLRRKIEGITCRVLQAESGFEGTPLQLVLEMRTPQAISMQLGLASEPRQPLHLVAGEARPLTLGLPARKRGVHAPGRLLISGRDRLGLMRAEHERTLGGRYWVYPAAHGERPLPEPAGRPPPAGGDEFEGIRPYRAGDAPARIHWKSLARGSTLQTKQFGGGDGLRHGPRVLDESRLADLPREARLSQLCAWVLACETQGEPYALRLQSGPSVPLGQGLDQRLRCLRLLAEAPRA
ncbi:MAG: DUF58 domain-containing protein [Halothiobacillaceae bacterium]|nr:MAG: DUF58 domain-containing protein [Halothiobacillaceae bacterium]